MEPMLSMQVAALLLALAKLGGLALGAIHLSGAMRPPSWLALLHGVLAAAGLSGLIYAAICTGLPILARVATATLLVAASGGLFLNRRYHARQQPLPLMALHVVVAVTGFALLLWCLSECGKNQRQTRRCSMKMSPPAVTVTR